MSDLRDDWEDPDDRTPAKPPAAKQRGRTVKGREHTPATAAATTPDKRPAPAAPPAREQDAAQPAATAPDKRPAPAAPPAREQDATQPTATAPDKRPAPAAPPPAADTFAALAEAADGLLVMSETDAPFEAFRWQGDGPLTPAALLTFLELPPDTLVETRSLEDFFAPYVRDQDWFGDEERATAARFAALRTLIADRLRDVTVYRVGERKIIAIVAGTDAAGAIGGLRTILVET